MAEIISDIIRSVNLADELYPPLLKAAGKPPQLLYYRGKLISEELSISVVGSRTPTAYGKQAANEIVQGLVSNGLTIVSGLAPGIDTISHQVAVKNGKRTIAVLGTGLDTKSIYPQDNLRLAREIINNDGCLVSEYPERTAGSKFTFPRRNRIISGLSLGVVIIEAKERSGALITASWAKKQKRRVFAVPGSIYSPLSAGTNSLIKQGDAEAITEANDILKAIGLAPKLVNRFQSPDPLENKIIELLRNGPLSIDEIIGRLSISPQKIISALSSLEINGMVNNLGNGIYGPNVKI